MIGTALIGFGGGLFAAGTLTAAMALATRRRKRAWRSARGARCRLLPQAAASRSAVAFATSVTSLASHAPRSASALTGSVGRLQRRLSHRNRTVVCHADRNRSACALDTCERPCRTLIFIEVRPCRISRLANKKGAVSHARTKLIWTSHRSRFTFSGSSSRCLIFYLRREDKREGYPLESNTGSVAASSNGFPRMPEREEHICCATAMSPRCRTTRTIAPTSLWRRSHAWPGAPLRTDGQCDAGRCRSWLVGQSRGCA